MLLNRCECKKSACEDGGFAKPKLEPIRRRSCRLCPPKHVKDTTSRILSTVIATRPTSKSLAHELRASFCIDRGHFIMRECPLCNFPGPRALHYSSFPDKRKRPRPVEIISKLLQLSM